MIRRLALAAAWPATTLGSLAYDLLSWWSSAPADRLWQQRQPRDPGLRHYADEDVA